MKIFRTMVIGCFALFFSFLFISPLYAYVMSSGNYRIESNSSIGAEGGQDWASANYIFRDTLGEVSTGLSDSNSYKVKAGFQEMQETYITVSAPGPASLAPDIPGMSGGSANASISVTVITDNAAGFNMGMKSAAVPAMPLVGDPTIYFADYPSTATYSWSVSSGNAQFGFTVEPDTVLDTATAFLDDSGSSCGVGDENNADTCWAGFTGTTNIPVINRTTRTDNTGEAEYLKFRAQANNKFLKEGTYSSTLTMTVSTN